MKLYLVKRTDEVDYDEAAGFVVAAPSVAEAIRLINTGARGDVGGPGDEGNWPIATPVLELGTAKRGLKAGLILRDFRAG